MAITNEEVQSTNVIQFSDDDDDYADLIAAVSGTLGIAGDNTMPQMLRANRPLYFPTGIGVEWEGTFLVLDPLSGIATQTIDTSDTYTTARTGLRIKNGTIIINVSSDSTYTNVNSQRPAQYVADDIIWASIGKLDFTPLQLEGSTLIFCTSENGNNNALPLSYVVGSTVIRDPHLTGSNDRIFVAAAAKYEDSIFQNWPLITFSDATLDKAIQSFENVRIRGADTEINLQGAVSFNGLRLPGNSLANNTFSFFGGSGAPTARRYLAWFGNMTPFIDGGVDSTNNAFPLFQKHNHANINGIPRFYGNYWRLRVLDDAGDPLQGARIMAFRKNGTGDLFRETAMDFDVALERFYKNTGRYADATDTTSGTAGEDVATRLAANDSLDGTNTYHSNSDGYSHVSGETAESLLAMPAVTATGNGTTATVDRVNSSEHKTRITLWGYHTKTSTLPIGYDTLEDASVLLKDERLQEDSGISEDILATVEAYSDITDLNQLYDYIRFLEYEIQSHTKLKHITKDGKIINFPTGSRFTQDASQVEPVTVDFSGSTPEYIFRTNLSTIGVAANEKFTGIDLTNTGDAGDVSFGSAVGVADMSGVTIKINTAVDAISYIGEINGGVTTHHEETADSTGLISLKVNATASIRSITKKRGYIGRYHSWDVEDSIEESVELTRDQHVDLSADITGYGYEDQVSDTNKLYFKYFANTSHLVFGIVDLRNEPVLCLALWDDRITTFDGLKWLYNYNLDGTYDDNLDGRAYENEPDRIKFIHQTLSFRRVAGLTQAQQSYWGQYMEDQDENAYSPPISNNNDVRIPSLQTLNILKPRDVRAITREMAMDEVLLDAIADAVTAETIAKLGEADILNTYAQMNLVKSNSDDIADDAIQDLTLTDDTVDFIGVDTANNWTYLIIKTDVDMLPRHATELSMRIRGALDESDDTDIADATEVDAYLDTDIDLIDDISQYMTDHTGFLDSDGMEKTVSNTPTAKYNRIIIFFRHATAQVKLQLSNLTVTAHHSEYAASATRQVGAQTSQMRFLDNAIRSVPTDTVARILYYVIDGTEYKYFVYDTDKKRHENLEFEYSDATGDGITGTSYWHHRLYSINQNTDKIEIHDLLGNHIETSPSFTPLDAMRDIAVTDDRIYVLNRFSATSHIYVYDHDWDRIQAEEIFTVSTYTRSVAITVHDGKLFLLDNIFNDKKVAMFDIISGDAQGTAALPDGNWTGLDIQGDLAVLTENDNHRIRFFDITHNTSDEITTLTEDADLEIDVSAYHNGLEGIAIVQSSAHTLADIYDHVIETEEAAVRAKKLLRGTKEIDIVENKRKVQDDDDPAILVDSWSLTNSSGTPASTNVTKEALD